MNTAISEGDWAAISLNADDPLFFGSYMHLHVRLMKHYPTEVIPGVTAMSGCWSAARLPIARGDDVLAACGQLATTSGRKLSATS